MERLLRIGLNSLLNSLLPIIMWFLMGEIIDRSIVNIFTITYSFQFIISLIVAIFAVGPNITAAKNGNKKIIDSNILLGTFIIFIITIIFSINVNSYMSFMNIEITTLYTRYCIYSFFLMSFQAVVKLICEKLYFKNKNKESNNITTLFNILNIILAVVISLIVKNTIQSIIYILLANFLVVIFLLIKYIDSLTFRLCLKENFKYASNEIFDSLGMFIIYFIGQKITFGFGAMYLFAMNFQTMITDAQWDMSYSIITAATIDSSKDKLKYEESLKNANKLARILVLSSLLMGIVLYWFYKPNLLIVAIFLGVEFFDILLTPKIWIRQQYIQINYSAKKNVFHKNVYEIIRIVFSFVPTPFCTYIGQLVAFLYEIAVYNFYYNDKFYIEDGYLKMKGVKKKVKKI